MADSPKQAGSSLEMYELSRCCAEAQSDGVPCPTLGRDCQICDRAVIVGKAIEPPPHPPIRPVGND